MSEATMQERRLKKRIHFSERGGAIFFMSSRRPILVMNEADSQFWLLLAHAPLVEAVPEALRDSAERFVNAGICDIVPTVFSASRKKVLIIEPHCDDAALSLGGTILLLSQTHEFTIATLGGRSNFTSYLYRRSGAVKPEVVSEIRRHEGERFAEMIGGRYVALQNNEATLRFHDGEWSPEWMRENIEAVKAFTNCRSSRDEHDHWKASARELLAASDAEEVWIPLGIGMHTDHEMARNVLLELASEDNSPFANRVLRLYSDVPYDAQYPDHKACILEELASRGAVLHQESRNVAGVFQEKLELLSIFASQFKISVIGKAVRRSAECGASELLEPLWTVVERPRAWNWRAVSIHGQLSRSEAAFCKRWLTSIQKARLLRVLVVLPAGRFREGISWIRSINPDLSICAYTTENSHAEVVEACLPGVRVRKVGSGAARWAMLAARLAVGGRAPTLFLTGGTRSDQARQMARLWLFSPTLVVDSFDQALHYLARAHSEGPEGVRNSVGGAG